MKTSLIVTDLPFLSNVIKLNDMKEVWIVGNDVQPENIRVLKSKEDAHKAFYEQDEELKYALAEEDGSIWASVLCESIVYFCIKREVE